MPHLGESSTTAVGNMNSDPLVKAMVQYLAKDDDHQSVKPYYLYLDYNSDLPPTNTSGDNRFVQIRNARDLCIPSRDMFDKWGFAKLQLDCPLTSEDYWSDEKVEEVLYPKYKEAAQFLFPTAARVEVLEHNVSRGLNVEGIKELIHLGAQTSSSLDGRENGTTSPEDEPTK
jgi:hypothetical protein